LDLTRHRDLAVLVLLLVGVRVVSMIVVAQPGYTDAYYYATVASRVAHGDGLTADFVWNFLEAPRFLALPIASHRFWMPLATLVQAAGIVPLGGLLGDLRAGQLAIVLVAALIPVVTYAAARGLGASASAALLGAGVAGLGGAFAPAWVSVDAFAPAAVIGTAFFIVFARAARGSVAAGVTAGLLVGLLYLTRAEGALFGLALLWLAGRPISRGAGASGSLVAIAVGGSWLVRNVSLGYPDDLLARAVLLVRYEDFFAVNGPTLGSFLSSPGEVVSARLGALGTNAVTAAMSLLVVLLVPLIGAARRRRARADVGAFVALAVLVYLVQSLAFAPHSVRGSYFHSLAAFFPFAVALAAAGTEEMLAPTRGHLLRLVAATALLGFGAVSTFALGEWDVAFNTPYRARVAAAALLPEGPIVVTDAAAWRWITGRVAIVAPADGPLLAGCAAQIYLANTLILEPAHFSRYDDLYGSQRTDLFTLRSETEGIRIYSLRPENRCIVAFH